MENKDQLQEEVLGIISKLYRCSVILSMGTGKTLLGLKYLDLNYTDYCKFLVVAPKLSVVEEWKNQAKIWGLEYLIPHITFSTYLSLSKQSHDFDSIVFDEVHNLLDTKRVWLLGFKGRILGLTGSEPRAKSSKSEIIKQYCPIVYRYKVDAAVNDMLLNDYKVIVHKLYLSNEKDFEVVTKKKSFFTSEVANYNYWCRRLDESNSPKSDMILRVMRMKALMSYSTKEKYAQLLLNSINDKCILFCNTQKQADTLAEYSVHSKHPNAEFNLQMFKEGKINKLAAVLQLSEGVNIPQLKECIIMHSYSGAGAKFLQRLGRILRLAPDQTATVHVLCFMHTADEVWLRDALKQLNSDKIIWKETTKYL